MTNSPFEVIWTYWDLRVQFNYSKMTLMSLTNKNKITTKLIQMSLTMLSVAQNG